MATLEARLLHVVSVHNAAAQGVMQRTDCMKQLRKNVRARPRTNPELLLAFMDTVK